MIIYSHKLPSKLVWIEFVPIFYLSSSPPSLTATKKATKKITKIEQKN